MVRTLASALLLVTTGPMVAGAQQPTGRVDFSSEIQPILVSNCYACHGPDEAARQADLRLDIKDGAFASRDGAQVIVPGDPEQSPLLRRIRRDDDRRMPPSDSGKTLPQSRPF